MPDDRIQEVVKIILWKEQAWTSTTLSVDDQVLVVMDMTGFDYKDVADVLGLSPWVVRPRLSRILKRLRQQLDAAQPPRPSAPPHVAGALHEFNVYKRLLELAKSSELAAEDHGTITYATNDPEQAELLVAMQSFIRAELTEPDPFASQAVHGGDELDRLHSLAAFVTAELALDDEDLEREVLR